MDEESYINQEIQEERDRLCRSSIDHEHLGYDDDETPTEPTVYDYLAFADLLEMISRKYRNQDL